MSARLKGDVEWIASTNARSGSKRNPISNKFKGLGSDDEATEFNAFGEILGTALCTCQSCFFSSFCSLNCFRYGLPAERSLC